MSELVTFFYDPICPWCYQTSRWLRRVAELGAAELRWGVFSLELQNAGEESAEYAEVHARSSLGLRTALAVRDAAGVDAEGALYAALGRRVHEEGEPLQEPATVKAALADVGLEAGLAEQAGADDAYGARITEEHGALVERTRSFGVPTIVLDGGDGPAIFGPVIAEPPADDDEALELFAHVVWLARYDNFAELKRDRTARPDLASVRRRDRERGAR